MDLYRQEVLEHTRNPKNFGTLDDANVQQKNSNPMCGDEMHIDLKVVDGIIQDIRFSGESCAIAKAGASMLTEAVKGKSIEEALKSTKEEQLARFGSPLTPSRQKCALLSYDTLQQALAQVK